MSVARFSYALKQRNKALNVFADAKARLADSTKEFLKHLEESKANEEALLASLTDERAAREFAQNTIESNHRTIKKIEDLLT